MDNYRDKVRKLIDELGEKHIDFYFEKTKEEVEKIVEDALKKFELKNDYDFFYVSNYLIKHIIGNYDEHTAVMIDTSRLPLNFKMINNKIYVIDSHDILSKYKYAQLTLINNIDIKQICKEIEDRVCYIKKGWLDYITANLLHTVVGIKSLPSINAADDIVFTLNGEDVNITDAIKKIENVTSPKKEFMSYELLDNVIKVNYRQCIENEMGQMKKMVRDIKKNKTITKFIIDLRGNTGGSSKIIKPLIDYLKGKQIITLTDNAVFSSGLHACNDLKNIGSKFIGTDIGTAYNAFGDIKVFNIDNFEVLYSTKYFYYNNKKISSVIGKHNFKKFKTNEKNRSFFKQYDFKIDKIINTTLDDYKKGIDPILNEAIKMLKNMK